VPLVIARLLLARGIDTAQASQRYLSPRLDHLHSAYLMLGMREAVARIEQAIAAQERILIYGDYDVDGTTAVVILKTAIELSGGSVHFHVPHRLREGYGMRDDVIERAHESGVRLIISVDTGIRAFTAAETCHRLGLDLIVTDHHLPQAEGVPRAAAVLNPNQQGCDYPCKALCGAGVAFKVAQALLEKSDRARLIPPFLKMVALETIADAVPLTGENRVFAALGLEGLRKPVNAGLKALFEVAELPTGRALTVTDVAFRLAPRINAAGRMDVARDVVDLLTLRDAAVVRELAERLDRLNTERQQEEARIMAEIHGRVEREPELHEAWCIVVDGEGWHKGVIGIAATRVVDRWNKPALVITREGDLATGSGRSIEAFHLLDSLESCAPLFSRFGGHAFAAGFALPVERIPELRHALDQRARAMLTIEDLQPVMRYDAEVDLNGVTPELFRDLQRMEPFGMGNPEPKFVARGAVLTKAPKLLKEKHAKLYLTAGQPKQNGNGTSYRRSFAAMGWRMAERTTAEALAQGDSVDLVYSITENLHPDFGGIELCLCDFIKTEKAAVVGS